MKSAVGLTACAILLSTAQPALSQPGDLYLGLKAGQVRVDDVFEGELNPNEIEIEGDSAVGARIGYQVTPNVSVELEYVSGGFEVTSRFGDAPDGDVETTAAYVAYRSSGELYFAGRLGFISRELSFMTATDSDSGGSFSLGAGYRLNEVISLEADYTLIDEDANWLLLSLMYSF